MAYEKVKETWESDDPVMPEHLNRIETQYDEMKTDLEKTEQQIINIGVVADPTLTPNGHAGKFRGRLNNILGSILNRINLIIGLGTWTATPPANLQELRDHIDSENPHVGSEPADPNIVKTNKEATFQVPIQAHGNDEYEKAQIRNITIASRNPKPDEGNNGDIWLIYNE